jgi:hypothetical protein
MISSTMAPAISLGFDDRSGLRGPLSVLRFNVGTRIGGIHAAWLLPPLREVTRDGKPQGTVSPKQNRPALASQPINNRRTRTVVPEWSF